MFVNCLGCLREAPDGHLGYDRRESPPTDRRGPDRGLAAGERSCSLHRGCSRVATWSGDKFVDFLLKKENKREYKKKVSAFPNAVILKHFSAVKLFEFSS